jgi:hypothetical protein
MKFTTEQCVFIVESFARKKTDRKCIRKFHRKYPDSPVPTASCVSKLVKKWRATGSVSRNIFMQCDPFFNQLNAEDNMGIFSKTTLQHIWLMQPQSQYEKCFRTE